MGLLFDFNFGCRIQLPHWKGMPAWKVRLSDLDAGCTLFETTLVQGKVTSTKKYAVRFGIEVWMGDEKVMHHRYDARDQEVLIQFPEGALGDLLGWFPYAVRFQAKHGCRLTCALPQTLIELLAPAYPGITFVTHDQVEASRYYATYNIGIFHDDDAHVYQPTDFRLVGLHRTAGYILGVNPQEAPPTIVLPDDSRPIPEKYVCIATQSTMQSKYWNHPDGWARIVRFLKDQGYRVVCIDQKAVYGDGITWNHRPEEAEDQTGDRPLAERARWIKHADVFIGLSSGLSWLAWAMGTPVVMISGFTHPVNEFHTPYRVINWHTCNSCWNDPSETFDQNNFRWCPRHHGTPREFECTRLIQPEQVQNTLRTIPIFNA